MNHTGFSHLSAAHSGASHTGAVQKPPRNNTGEEAGRTKTVHVGDANSEDARAKNAASKKKQGWRNAKSSCFANAAARLLEKSILPNIELPDEQHIRQRTSKVLEQIKVVEKGGESSLEDVLKTHWECLPLPGSAGGQQQDTSEFLYNILDDVKYAGPKIADSIECCDCQTYKVLKAQPTAIINMPMARSISAGLGKYQETQKLSTVKAKPGEVPIGQCKSCKGNEKYLRLTEVREAPKVLLLLVNRWNEHQEKDISPVEINDRFTLNERNYTLSGWVSHQGTRESGHYCYTHREGNSSYVHYNDNKPLKSSTRIVNNDQRNVYLACYICENAAMDALKVDPLTTRTLPESGPICQKIEGSNQQQDCQSGRLVEMEKRMEKRDKEMTHQIEALKEMVENQKKEMNKLVDQKASIRAEIGVLKKNNNEARKEISTLEEKVSKLEVDKSRLRGEVARIREKMDEERTQPLITADETLCGDEDSNNEDQKLPASEPSLVEKLSADDQTGSAEATPQNTDDEGDATNEEAEAGELVDDVETEEEQANEKDIDFNVNHGTSPTRSVSVPSPVIEMTSSDVKYVPTPKYMPTPPRTPLPEGMKRRTGINSNGYGQDTQEFFDFMEESKKIKRGAN